VLKHAGPGAHTEVRLGTDRSGIVIEVVDDGYAVGYTDKGLESASGRQPADSDRQDRRSAAGHGIVGMRERALLLGGTLDARPRPGGGFRVVAHLPTGGEPA
jgi:signal transduction histidine kinase